MSEYQYYEFQAIDRPLTKKEMGELRSCSTRARTTPTSFVNEYSWGNFKGDEDAWMEKYFDAFLHFALASLPGCGRWKSARLLFRTNATREPTPSTREAPSATNSASMRRHSNVAGVGRYLAIYPGHSTRGARHSSMEVYTWIYIIRAFSGEPR